MTPLDLRKHPPRMPREELDGLAMLPRMIDVARALLPGGNVGEYQIGRGLSGLVFRYYKTDREAFISTVAQAQRDDEVAVWLHACNPEIDNQRLSRLLLRIRVADVSGDIMADFLRYYGADHDPNRLIVDILEEDDRNFVAVA